MNHNNQIKKTILIVEDDLSMLEPLAERLGEEGFGILSERDGEAGLASALRNHPDLVLLDIMMPKMDGLTMLGKLRQDSWGKSAKVVMLTNLTDINHVSEALKSEAFDYIVKTNWSLKEIVAQIKAKLA